MGLNPNELFSGFKNAVMEVSGIGTSKKCTAKDLIKGNANSKPYGVYPLDILSANSEVSKAIQFDAIYYSWKGRDTRGEIDKEGGGTVEQGQHLWSCFLPIPAITTSDGHSYPGFNGWGLGEAVSRAMNGGVNNTIDQFKQGEYLKAAQTVSGIVAPVAVRKGYEMMKDTFGDEMNVMRRNVWNGAAINPLSSVIYESSELKTYNFDFMLVARNRAETSYIDYIVKQLQRLSRPTLARADVVPESLAVDVHIDYLTHPCLWKIKFIGEGTEPGSNIAEYLPKIKTCVMERITISYQEGSSPVFFRASGAPMVYKLSMAFKEMYISTQEDV
jgi:hypothetical protein